MISIIVPCYNKHDMTNECILSLLNTVQEDVELIVIDNGSVPEYKPPFSGFVETRIIRNENNLGYPKAVNQGIEAAKGDMIILLNNDVTVTQGAIYKLAQWLNEYDIMGCLTNFCAGIQKIDAEYQNKEQLEEFATYLAQENEGDSQEVNYVIGFCMAFKKSVFDVVGKFDESIWPASGEEVDFCFRARKAGYKIGIANDVYVHHEGSQTFKDLHDAKTVHYGELCEQIEGHLAEKYGRDYWRKQIVHKYSYLIFAPEYQHNSAGIRALYELRKHIEFRGYEARIAEFGTKEKASPDDIVIYPEIISGNPLGGKTVARWVLNFPGLLGGDKKYDSKEIIFTWDKKYYDAPILTVPIIEDFFKDQGLKRSGGCFWIGKGSELWERECKTSLDNFGRLPRELHGMQAITYDWPATREELAELFNSKEVFYTYDNNTALISEAKACGCKVVVIGEELKSDFDENIKHWRSQVDEFIHITQEAAQDNDEEIRLAIGVPCTFPMVPASFFHSFALMNKPAHIYIYENNGHIDDLRNNIVERALYEGVTHLIMMDVDQVYPIDTIPRLLAHNLPVVGCRVHRRYPPFDSLMLRIEKVDENTNAYVSIDEWKDGELLEVDATGGGCVMFNMDVFRKLKYPWFETKLQDNGSVLGEDIHLCQKIQQAGYKIFVDSGLEVGHLAQLIINGKTNLLYRSMKQKKHQRNLEQALKINNSD